MVCLRAGQPQAVLAFCYAARGPYGLTAFAEALGGRGTESWPELLSLADGYQRPMLQRCIEILDAKREKASSLRLDAATAILRGSS